MRLVGGQAPGLAWQGIPLLRGGCRCLLSAPCPFGHCNLRASSADEMTRSLTKHFLSTSAAVRAQI